jgi:hypothetical protein
MKTGQSKTDCRSDEGVTVALIDSIIGIARVLCGRNLETREVTEALKDLRNDEDVKSLLIGHDRTAEKCKGVG